MKKSDFRKRIEDDNVTLLIYFSVKLNYNLSFYYFQVQLSKCLSFLVSMFTAFEETNTVPDPPHLLSVC